MNGITTDSRQVEPGVLFVALPGTRVDGHSFMREVVARGAAAVVAERDGEEALGVPLVRVHNSRIALARLAATWHGHPARRLRLVGITGTVGKTSVLKMIEAILHRADQRLGTIGTLGVSAPQGEEQTGYTAPDPLLLHAALAQIAEAGCELAAMEVTSHALDQERVHGLTYDLGVFTNIVPLEHADYHTSFRQYVEVKARFLETLRPGAPLFHSHDDRAVRRLVRRGSAVPIDCGEAPEARVRIDKVAIGMDGTSLRLGIREPLPRLDGGRVGPLSLPLRLSLLGQPSVVNAALAASASLSLGADPEVIRAALADFPPVPRRMEILHRGRFLVMDDAANHPDSVSALFEVIEQLPIRRAHAVFAIRGQRGVKINRRTAEALAIWAQRRPLDTLLLTLSEDAVSERDRVEEHEREAFRAALRRAGIPFEESRTLDEAIPAALDRAREGDLVLLLGTQGMDGGAERAHRWLAAHEADA